MDEFENINERVPTPRGVSVALALVDITKGGGKRKGHDVDKKILPWKRRCVEGNLPGRGRKKSKVVADDEFLSMREDEIERPNVVIVREVTDGVDHDRVMQRFQEEDPHHAKATQVDDAVVQVKIWNQKVVEQLTLHWSSKQTQSHLELKFVKPFDVMRDELLQQWKVRVSRDFYKWYEVTGCQHPEHTEYWLQGSWPASFLLGMGHGFRFILFEVSRALPKYSTKGHHSRVRFRSSL